MRVGLIAEGRADLAVLTNVLKGALGISGEDIQHLRPEYFEDETDLHHQPEDRFGNWEIVRRECIDGEKISEFLSSPVDAGERLVVIQIDTAECEKPGYDVQRPDASHDASVELCRRVIERIEAWLAGRFGDATRFAVAMEETDAWVLTLFVDGQTDRRPRPKEDLEKALNRCMGERERKRLFQLKAYPRYEELSKPLRKAKELRVRMTQNHSLARFVASLPTGDIG